MRACEPSEVCGCATANTYALPGVSVKVTGGGVIVAPDIRTNAMIRLPAVLAEVKEIGKDVTPVPCAEFDWTSTIPVPAVAVPVSVTAVEVAGGGALTFSVAVLAPVVVGLNVTLIVHEVAPVGGSLAGQVVPDTANPEPAVAPVMVDALIVSDAPPGPLVLVTVTERAALVVPTGWLVNASGFGVTV